MTSAACVMLRSSTDDHDDRGNQELHSDFVAELAPNWPSIGPCGLARNHTAPPDFTTASDLLQRHHAILSTIRSATSV